MAPGRLVIKKDVLRRRTANRKNAQSTLRPVVDTRIHPEAAFIGGNVANTRRHARQVGSHVDRAVHLRRQCNEIGVPLRGEESLKHQERREPEGIGTNHHPACQLQRQR